MHDQKPQSTEPKKVIVGHFFDNEVDAKAWCNRQKKSAIVIQAEAPNGQIFYMALLKSIAETSGVRIELAYYVRNV